MVHDLHYDINQPYFYYFLFFFWIVYYISLVFTSKKMVTELTNASDFLPVQRTGACTGFEKQSEAVNDY